MSLTKWTIYNKVKKKLKDDTPEHFRSSGSKKCMTYFYLILSEDSIHILKEKKT